MTTIRITELHNKTRKGTYLYIKRKGERGRYYKYTPTDSVEGIFAYHIAKAKKGTIQQYKDTYSSVIKGEKKTSTRLRQEAQRYKRKKFSGIKLNEVMQKGIGEVLVHDMRLITNKDLQEKKEELLQHIVLDKELRSLIATEENMKKLSHRLEHKLRFLNKKGELLDTINAFQKTSEEVRSILQQKFKNGTEISEGSRTTWQTIIADARLGTSHVVKEGLLSRVEATILFRKG